ncbi:hypothetical protein EAH_00058720, partial [Eimeria acervulina]
MNKEEAKVLDARAAIRRATKNGNITLCDQETDNPRGFLRISCANHFYREHLWTFMCSMAATWSSVVVQDKAGTGSAPAEGVHSAVIAADVSEPKEADTTIVSVVNSWPTMSL